MARHKGSSQPPETGELLEAEGVWELPGRELMSMLPYRIPYPHPEHMLATAMVNARPLWDDLPHPCVPFVGYPDRDDIFSEVGTDRHFPVICDDLTVA